MKPLPFREILGILIGDLIVAESQAAKASADFIREAGFVREKEGSDHWGMIRFVTFSFTVQDLGRTKVRTIRVPLLSLLPIPLLQIDQVEYEFYAKVNEEWKIEPSPNKVYELGSAAYGLAQPFLDLKCSIAPFSSDTTSNKKDEIPKIRVKLTMRQADLPAGLSTTLNKIEQTLGSMLK